MTVSTDTRKTGIEAGMTLLAASAVAVPHTGTTDETALATISIPAGAMGLNGGLHIYTTWTFTNSGNNKTMRVRLGGAAGTAYLSVTQGANVNHNAFTKIRNRNSASSQVGSAATIAGGLGASGAANTTSSVNTAVAQDVVISGQLTSAGETITLESYEIWLTP